MDHSELSSMLGQRLAEMSVARGLSANGRMVEIYATDDGATWTMVVARRPKLRRGQRRSLGRAGPERARSGSVAMSNASSPPACRREA